MVKENVWSNKISAQTKCVLKESATKNALKKNLWSKKISGQICGQRKPVLKEKCVVKNQCSKNQCSKNQCSKKISAQRICAVKEYVRSNLQSKNQCPSNLRSLALPKMWSSREKKCGQNSALPKNVWSKKIINNLPHKQGITTFPFSITNSLA